jgi:hypothetical protein
MILRADTEEQEYKNEPPFEFRSCPSASTLELDTSVQASNL